MVTGSLGQPEHWVVPCANQQVANEMGGQMLWAVTCHQTANHSIEILTRDSSVIVMWFCDLIIPSSYG